MTSFHRLVLMVKTIGYYFPEIEQRERMRGEITKWKRVRERRKVAAG